ncbi:17294_t:CDS:2 [Funneliformis geosporum]|uniref:17294_t:CDS:1 n=1 Tax=Funneliformis geosporum TaxID=1117311 RepID=A0A9W4T201_9GLOM|nr:17294_t:CDS:2 [Funneliformis geosporum]
MILREQKRVCYAKSSPGINSLKLDYKEFEDWIHQPDDDLTAVIENDIDEFFLY